MTDEWRPTEGRYIHPSNLTAGMVIALNAAAYRYKAWRVHELRNRDVDDDRIHVILRPVGDLYDLSEHDHSISIAKWANVYRLPEHYAVCHTCGQIPPCAEVWTDRLSTADAERTARYEVEGICPWCRGPVTQRQESHRFEENLYVPLGPPVTFHARQLCIAGAVAYDEALAKKNGTQPRLSCEGHVTHHLDGHRSCTNATCPGDRLRHRSMSMCYVPDEKCNRPECWALDHMIPAQFARRKDT